MKSRKRKRIWKTYVLSEVHLPALLEHVSHANLCILLVHLDTKLTIQG
jgi:hypothetical protein